MIKVNGVGRIADNENVMFVSFNQRLTDDEMRLFHEYIREWSPPDNSVSTADGKGE